MTRTIAGIFILLFTALQVSAQQPALFSYTVLNIPDSLKKDANAVVRLDEGVLDILSPSKYVLKVHQVVTILNSEGTEHLRHVLGFDKFYKVENVEINMFDQLGMEVRRYKKKDFDIRSAYDGVSFVTDDKLMHLTTPAPGYPCTIETKYEISTSGYIELPNWYMNSNVNSTQLFRYVIKVPSEIDIRYRSLNMVLEPQMKIDGNYKTYTWEVKNIPVKKIEANGYEPAAYLPQVEVAPNSFEYDGHKGAFKNWSDFGKWNYALYQEKTPFGAERMNAIKAMTEKCVTTYGKIDVLYTYLKKNMRYLSIQLGIGGFKPFPAKFVDEKKYGDCKALTNYMKNLLSVVGIASYPALINAGYNKYPADTRFPSDPFNHVILCVPVEKDTIWLECTSNNAKTGFLGSFTENKNALLITEKGGVLVRTPASKAENNKLITRNEVFLGADGDAIMNTVLYATGDMLNTLEAIKSTTDADEQKNILVKQLYYKEPQEMMPPIVKDSGNGYVSQLKMTYQKLYDFKAGSKIFYPSQVSQINDEELKITESREKEYIFYFPYQKADTTIYHLPKNFSIDNLPSSKELSDDLVKYKRDIIYEPSSKTLRIYTMLILKKNIIPASSYRRVAELFNSIKKEEAEKIILKSD